AVIVEKAFRLVDSIRNFRDEGAHRAIGRVPDRLNAGVDRTAPIARDELAESAHAELATRDLRAQIAQRGFGKAQIVVDDLPQRVVALASVVDLERAQLQSLLIDLRGLDRAETLAHAADVDPMGAACGERRQFARVEARRIDHDVVEMLPAHEAVVHDNDVARREAAETIALDAVLHRDAQVREEEPQFAFVLRDHPAFAIDQAAAEVAYLVDHHVVGGLAQGPRHLVGIGIDGVAHDLDGDGIDFHRLSLRASVTMICPLSFTTAWSFAPMSVVEFGSSTTAGPASSVPTARPGPHRKAPSHKAACRGWLLGGFEHPRPALFGRGFKRRPRLRQPAGDRTLHAWHRDGEAQIDDLDRLVGRGVAITAIVLLVEANPGGFAAAG